MPRLIYSLQVELDTPPPASRALILPLDREGKCKLCRPLARGKRAIDLLPGDRICYCGRVHRVKLVQPYRWDEIASDVDPSTLPSGCVVA